MADATLIRVTKGEHFTLRLSFTDEAGDPYDLTGCVVKFYVRRRAGIAPLISKTVTTFDDAATGKASIYFADDDTELDIRAWYCQVIMTDATGDDHPSTYTTFVVTNIGSTTRDISVLLNVGALTPIEGQVSRRWVDSSGVSWVETIDTDGSLRTTRLTSGYTGLTLALQEA